MSTPDTATRTVRSLDIPFSDVAQAADGIEALYNDALDVILLRNAFDPAWSAAVGADLDRDDRPRDWARPNVRMPSEDVQLLGTDTPATPTFRDPRGASLSAYLESAARHASHVAGALGSGVDATGTFRAVIGACAGGRPVEVAASGDGRPYTPFTIRRLVDGRGIQVHHDYHYPLDLYADLRPRVDTGTLVSYVVTLQASEAGGELVVYGLTPDTPDTPKMPNGFSYDLAAIEARFHMASFHPGPGDLFLLASGRCLHRVERVVGDRARVTMGGFLALDRDRERVLFWS